MNEIEWQSDTQFSVGGVKFISSLHDYSLRSTAERLVILKGRENIEAYARLLNESPPRTALELGIYQGGSPALFTAWFDLEKFVGIDICKPVVAFDDFCASQPIGTRIRTHYGVSQKDQQQLDRIVREEFGQQPIDLIIDDASHNYSLTRRSFEILFPYLRAGSYYVIEDWGWAHWPGSTFYPGETALSMLIMELTMLCASRGDLISEVRVLPWYTFIRKAPAAPALKNARPRFALYETRHRTRRCAAFQFQRRAQIVRRASGASRKTQAQAVDQEMNYLEKVPHDEAAKRARSRDDPRLLE
jgi:cephalosporin hydroxylase